MSNSKENFKKDSNEIIIDKKIAEYLKFVYPNNPNIQLLKTDENISKKQNDDYKLTEQNRKIRSQLCNFLLSQLWLNQHA